MASRESGGDPAAALVGSADVNFLLVWAVRTRFACGMPLANLVLVQCATLFCTYPAEATMAAFARVTLARMSEARAVQMNGLGSML
jgi:hypothetical protein